MPKILDRLPVVARDDTVIVRNETVRVKQAEIIVWVSVAVKTALGWNPAVPRFPAILDTGHTHNFSVQQEQLVRWAGIRPEMLRVLRHIRQAGKRVPLHAANVWLHRNVPGGTAVRQDVPPCLLELPDGIAISSTTEPYPRLPLLGLRAILSNHLYLAVDGEREQVTLRTPDWRTLLLRWLT